MKFCYDPLFERQFTVDRRAECGCDRFTVRQPPCEEEYELPFKFCTESLVHLGCRQRRLNSRSRRIRKRTREQIEFFSVVHDLDRTSHKCRLVEISHAWLARKKMDLHQKLLARRKRTIERGGDNMDDLLTRRERPQNRPSEWSQYSLCDRHPTHCAFINQLISMHLRSDIRARCIITQKLLVDNSNRAQISSVSSSFISRRVKTWATRSGSLPMHR